MIGPLIVLALLYGLVWPETFEHAIARTQLLLSEAAPVFYSVGNVSLALHSSLSTLLTHPRFARRNFSTTMEMV